MQNMKLDHKLQNPHIYHLHPAKLHMLYLTARKLNLLQTCLLLELEEYSSMFNKISQSNQYLKENLHMRH